MRQFWIGIACGLILPIYSVAVFFLGFAVGQQRSSAISTASAALPPGFVIDPPARPTENPFAKIEREEQAKKDAELLALPGPSR